MISVTTTYDDIDEFHDADDVNLLEGGGLIVVDSSKKDGKALNGALAVYASGAWAKVEFIPNEPQE